MAYENTPYSAEAQQLAQRKKLLEALQAQAISPTQTQMVGDRVVPYGIGQGLTQIAQALIARKGLEKASERERELGQKVAQGRSEATQRVIDMMMGKPQTGGPLADATEYQQFSPEVKQEPMRAALTAATDPYLAGEPGIQNVIGAMMKNQQRGQYFTPYDVAQPDGTVKTMVFDHRTGKFTEPQDVITPPKYSPDVQETIEESKEKGKGQAKLGYEPELKKANVIATAEAEKITNKNKREMQALGKTAETQNVVDTIDSAMERASFWTTGILGQLLSPVGGTPQHDLANDLNTIKANIGFDRLQEMRDQSPTGGALGNVSDTENKLLQAAWNAVEQSQSQGQFKTNLERLKKQVVESWGRVAAAYEKDYGVPMSGYEESKKKLAETSTVTPIGAYSDEEKERRYQEWKAKQGL